MGYDRFQDMSPVDMMDRMVELESELRAARGYVSPSSTAKDVLDLMFRVAEGPEHFDLVSDEFIGKVYEVVNRTYSVNPYATVLSLRDERDIMRNQRDLLLRQRDAILAMCAQHGEIDTDAIIDAFLVDPAAIEVSHDCNDLSC